MRGPPAAIQPEASEPANTIAINAPIEVTSGIRKTMAAMPSGGADQAADET